MDLIWSVYLHRELLYNSLAHETRDLILKDLQEESGCGTWISTTTYSARQGQKAHSP